MFLSLPASILIFLVLYPELDMGHFFVSVTQPDPTQDFPDPTRSMSVDLWPDPVGLMKNSVNFLFCVQRIM